MSAAATTQAPVSVHSIYPKASSSLRQSPATTPTTSALEAHRNALRAGPALSYQAPSPCGSTSSSPVLGPLDRRRSSAREFPLTSSSLGKATGSGMWRSGSASSSSSSSEYWRRPSFTALSNDDDEDGDGESQDEQHGRLKRRVSDESTASTSSFDSTVWQRSSAKGSRGSSISNGSSIATSPGFDDVGIAPEDVTANGHCSSKMNPLVSPRSALASNVHHHHHQQQQQLLPRWQASPTEYGVAPADVEGLSVSAQALRIGHPGALGFVASDMPLASPSSLPGHSLHLPAAAIAARATALVARRRGTMGGPSITFDAWHSSSSSSSAALLVTTPPLSSASCAPHLSSSSSQRGRMPQTHRSLALRRPKTMASPQNHQGRRIAASTSLSTVDVAAYVDADADADAGSAAPAASSAEEAKLHILADIERIKSTSSLGDDVQTTMTV